MKKHFAIVLNTVLATVLCAPVAFAQASGTVKGTCKDAQGAPLVGALVVFQNLDNGQKYTLKCDKKGEYFSLGLTPGKYIVNAYKSPDDVKDNKPYDFVKGYGVSVGDNDPLDFDMKKEAEKQAKGEGLTPEQLKERQEQQAKAQKETNTVNSLNEKLKAANTAIQNKEYDTAIAALVEANQMDATRDILWYRLGDAYRLSATTQTDKAEKQKRYESAVDAYQKAIQLKQDAIQNGKEKDTAKANQQLAGFYINVADAYAKSNKIDDAVKNYDLAAKADPSQAATAYFNEGAVFTNSGHVDDANAAFDKCIAADPNRADAYYQKGVNLMGKATLKGDKQVPAPGTVEAFQKYLELAPTGPNADAAKAMIASFGESVETGFGNKKKTSKK